MSSMELCERFLYITTCSPVPLDVCGNSNWLKAVGIMGYADSTSIFYAWLFEATFTTGLFASSLCDGFYIFITGRWTSGAAGLGFEYCSVGGRKGFWDFTFTVWRTSGSAYTSSSSCCFVSGLCNGLLSATFAASCYSPSKLSSLFYSKETMFCYANGISENDSSC